MSEALQITAAVIAGVLVVVFIIVMFRIYKNRKVATISSDWSPKSYPVSDVRIFARNAGESYNSQIQDDDNEDDLLYDVNLREDELRHEIII